jgi:hypothetical protein
MSKKEGYEVELSGDRNVVVSVCQRTLTQEIDELAKEKCDELKDVGRDEEADNREALDILEGMTTNAPAAQLPARSWRGGG